MLLSRSFLGPFCFWIWRVLLILIITFCVVNFFFILAIIVDDKGQTGKEPAGMVNAKLEEIIQQKVYGVKPLYENKIKVPRTRILIMSYSERSPIAIKIAKDENIFYINVNKKLKETEHANLFLDWSQRSRTAIVASLSLIR